MSRTTQGNIAHYLPEAASAHPDKRAIVAPAGRDSAGRTAYAHYTFRQLDDACDAFARGLQGIGIARGTKALLMVRPGLDFIALTFSLFKLGAVPVLIDPGMGWSGFLRCVRQVAPEAFLGIPASHVLRLLCRRSFASVTIPVTLGRRAFWGGWSLEELRAPGGAFPPAPTSADEMAAILFTTGSTGPAKGVVYTHGIFDTQTRIIRREYGITDSDVDLACFPLFALFSIALGMTAVIPDMDPSRPAHVDPRRIVTPVKDHGVTFSFGSPALWQRVGDHCMRTRTRLPSLRRVLMAGAPVPGRLHRQMLEHVLPRGGDVHVPYGATEALPIASFLGSEMLAETDDATRAGAGVCVGRPLREARIRIIATDDEPIESWDEATELPVGEKGEIVVRGPVVTPGYYGLPEKTRLAKVREGDTICHRMGDLGYLDASGRLWFCGRKAHRVETEDRTLYSVCCEAVFNQHPHAARTALVGIGADRTCQTPVIVVEPQPDHFPRTTRARAAFAAELRELAQGSELTRDISAFLFHQSFPVDIRHNAKIKRELLAAWAEARLARSRRDSPV